jgi:hypothetical protein
MMGAALGRFTLRLRRRAVATVSACAGEYRECDPLRRDLSLAKLPQFIEDAYDDPLEFANTPAPHNDLLRRAPHNHLTMPSREVDLTGPLVTAVPRCRKATT